MSNREAAAASERPLPVLAEEHRKTVQDAIDALMECDRDGDYPLIGRLESLLAASAPQAVRMLTGEERRDVARAMDPAHTTWLLSDWPCARLFSTAVIRKFCEVNGIVPLAPQDSTKEGT